MHYPIPGKSSTLTQIRKGGLRAKAGCLGFRERCTIVAATLSLGFSGPANASCNFLGKDRFGRVFFKLELIRHSLGILVRDLLECGSALKYPSCIGLACLSNCLVCILTLLNTSIEARQCMQWASKFVRMACNHHWRFLLVTGEDLRDEVTFIPRFTAMICYIAWSCTLTVTSMPDLEEHCTFHNNGCIASFR